MTDERSTANALSFSERALSGEIPQRYGVRSPYLDNDVEYYCIQRGIYVETDDRLSQLGQIRQPVAMNGGPPLIHR